MAETFLTPVIRKLVEILFEEAKSLKGVHREIKSLKCELEIIQPFLRDAEAKTERGELSGATKVWLRQIREEADHIEDVFDEYVRHLACHRRRPGLLGSLRGAGRFVRALKPRYDVASEIRDIKKSLREIKERGQSYGLGPPLAQSCSSSGAASGASVFEAPRPVDARLDSLFIGEDELVGIDSTSEELRRSLVRGPPMRTVVSLVGKAGIGKTTLAKKVYDDVVMEGCFDCHVWINLSPSHTVDAVLKIMKNQLCPTTEQFAGEAGARDELINHLRNCLQRKRYVVVFDNVWQTDLWDVVKHALPSSNDKGNRIIITTQNTKIAYSFKTTPWDVVQELNSWSPELAWKLFCKKTFPFEFENRCPQELEKLARKIIRKCEGLPIAIVAIAGLLSSKEKVESEWQKVLEDLNFEFDENPQLTCVPKVLSYSFYDLPYCLRPCFLYFGVFPENYSIAEKALYRLWIAEGFIVSKGGKALEKVAEEYLNELIQRNLVSFEIHDGYERRCRVHDLVRDIILARVDELCLCQNPNENMSMFSGKARRLSINSATENVFKTVGDSSIRSCFLFGVNELTKSFMVSLFENYRLLKVLGFEDSPLDNLPKEVGNLFHLKYLSLRGTNVKSLPKSIGKLHNLQVLDVSDTLVQELPMEINKLRNLRHLLASQNDTETEISSDSCHGVRIHEGIGGLEELQTLEGVEANPGKVGFVKELQKLCKLRHLSLSKVTIEIGNSLGAAIQKMNCLERLDLASINQDEVLDLECISSPPPFLCFLSLKGRLQKLPGWISKLQNLQGLELFFSKLSDEPLKGIGNLPNLAFLLLYLAYDGSELHFEEGGFGKLKQLNLRKLDQLQVVKIDRGALPVLEELDIGPSPLMKEMPSDVQHLKSLRSLELTDMPKELVVSLQEDGGPDYWKIRHVPSVTFWYKRRGMIYKRYRNGSSKLLKYLKVDKFLGNSPHQSNEKLSHRADSQNLHLPSDASSSLDDSDGSTILAATPSEGSSQENKQTQVLKGQKIDQGKSRSDAKVDRGDLHKLEHQDDKRHCNNNVKRSVVNKTETLSKQITRGSIHLEGKTGIVSAALETRGHSANVRVQSQLFKHETFLKLSQGSGQSTEIEELKARVDTLTTMYEQLQREVCVQKHGSTSNEEVSAPSIEHHSSKASNTVSRIEEGKPCRAALTLKENITATGLACSMSGPENLQHRATLGEDNLRAIVEVPLPSQAKEPLGEKKVRRSSLAKRRKVPSHLLQKQQLGEKVPKGKRAKAEGQNITLSTIDISSLPALLRPVVVYAEKYMDRQSTLELAMPKDIVGREHKNWIDKQDILEFATMVEISAVCITVYIKKLYLRCHEQQIFDSFGFVCPSRLAFVPLNTLDLQMERANMLYDVLAQARKGQQFLLPYNGGQHWMLVVINPWADKAYWLDPLRKGIRSDIKIVVQRALSMFKSGKNGECVTFHPPKGSTKWIIVQSAPMQPGSVECGFYVMRYMRDIIYNEWNPIPTHFGGITEYDDQDMYDLRNEWGQFMQTLIHW